MIEINLVGPKARLIPNCRGIYILPLWQKAKTHFMTLTLKKRVFKDDPDRYKLSLVMEDKEN